MASKPAHGHPLDDWLPQHQFSETHSTLVAATPASCLAAAAALNPDDDRLIGTALALREAPGRLAEALGLRGALRQRRRFGLQDFLLLENDGVHRLVYGLVGQFWRADYGLRVMNTPEQFRAFDEAGVARLALSFHTEPEVGGQRTRLITTTRLFGPDAQTLARLRPYWWLIRPVSGLIRQRLLGTVRRSAEATAAG
ncbi:MAG: hypothetical protein CFE46_02590 [Burkholderiales bacterium PBB6]|nr:MAG: hypothetical protein CFE46_02590 [Burkholderiales bacterium PBB6]